MVAQPTGTVTLLFTDVEGSTLLLERLGVEQFAEALALHRRVLREAFARHGGYEVDEEGDAFLVAFQAAGEAVAAACEAQQGLASVVWPLKAGLRVRMGVHTGEPLPVPPKYVGLDVHRAARIMAAGHGGQVLVSETTAALLDGPPLRDLGPQRLKDMLGPIRLYQLEIDGLSGEFPPIRSLHQTNLPVAGWPLLGRERELQQMRAFVSEQVRLVTLTGPGGSGKTRLALQAAVELSDEFPDGVFFVALAPLRDTAAVRGEVAEAVGLQPEDDLVAWLRAKRVLLVLDNLEQLRGVDAVVAELLVGETTVLATSRAALRVASERELPVDPLPNDAAVELFVSRAAAAGRRVEADDAVAAVCRRLDNLPLALELVAARAKLLSPTVLLQRLEAALPLPTGGAADRPERQRTLNATIAWSHDLLDADAQAAFRRVSVFRGSFTLGAGEAVAGADLDQVATLLDQSLVKPLGEERFFLLETIRDYAREQLDEAGESDEYALRHAHHYLARLEENDAVRGAGMGERLAWFAAEEDNLRAMLDRLTATAPSEAARACQLLRPYWSNRGAYVEGRQRYRAVLDHAELSDETQVKLLMLLSTFEVDLGNLDAADDVLARAVAIAEAARRDDLLCEPLRESAWASARRGQSDEAVRLARRAAQLAEDLDDETRIHTMHDFASLLGEARHAEEARTVFKQTLELAKSHGDAFWAMSIPIQLGFIDNDERRFEDAQTQFETALDQNRAIGHYSMDVWGRWGLGYALLGLGQRPTASAAFAEALEIVLAAPQTVQSHFEIVASGIAHTASRNDAPVAARLRGAINSLRAERGWNEDPRNLSQEHYFDQPLIAALGQEAWEQEQTAGATMTLDDVIALARTLARAEVPTG